MSRASKRTAWWHRFTGGGRSAGSRLLGENTKLRCERLESRYLLTANLMDAPIVVLQTNNGDVAMELLSTEAPGTVDNFLTYVQHEDYNNAIFHRLSQGFVLQGGGFNADQELVEGSTPGLVHTHDPILNEPGLSNLRGTVAMAKQGNDPDSATNQFFFNLGDNSENLDNQNGGFTVFATVADMTAVDLMASHTIYDFGSPFNELPLSGTAPDLTLLMIQSTSGDGEIRGTVFADLNRDGVQDVGELGIAGATVFVDANDDGQLDGGELSLTTDSQGEYTFTVPGGTDVNPLNYVVRHVLPAGTEATIGDGRATADVKIGRYTENVNFGEVDLPTVEVTAGDATASEEGSDPGSFTLTVTGAAGPVEVFFSLSGTATAGVDYQALSGSVMVDGTAVVVVVPIDDTQYNEGSETVSLTLTPQSEVYQIGAASSALVSIAENDLASAVADVFSVFEETADNALVVLANDDLPSGALITAFTSPDQMGVVAISPDQQNLVYSPTGGFRGTESFSYTVTLPDSGTLNADVTVNVLANPPLPVDDLFTVTEDSSSNALSVLANDALTSGASGPLNITATGTPSAGGSVTVAGDGQSLLYSPAADFAGSETFGYTVDSPGGDTAMATVTVTVTPTSDAPLLGDDTFIVVEDSVGQVLSVLVNDSLPAGETGALMITAVGTPSAGGSLTVAGDGQSLLYSPAADFAGSETFTYTAQAPHGGTAVAQVTVTVTPVADAPSLSDDTFIVVEDSVGQVLSVLANDSLPAGETGALMITAVGTPSAGGSLAVAGDGQSLLYSPAADFAGSETFTYTAEAPHGGTAVAQVTVTVTPASDAPLLGDDTFTVVEDSVDQVLSVLANDSLPAGETGALTITAVGTPSAGGSLAVAGDGQSLLYSPAADFAGSETFTYTVEAPSGGLATAQVTVTVTPVADAPSLSDDTFTVVEDSVGQVLSVLVNDSLPAGETGALMITAVGTPSAGGSLAVAGDGQSLLYSPAADFAGSETFTYTAEAPHGGTAVAQVTVTVTPVADAPSLSDDTFTVVEDSVDQVLSVLANDSLPAGETGALTITAVGTPSAGGSLAVAGDGQSLLYSPAADFAGSETFTYTVEAPSGGLATAQVTVTVTPVADAPSLSDDTFTVVEDSVDQVLSVLVNDSLPAGETGALMITAVGTPSAGGSLAVAGDGQSLLYSPAADFAGSETFTYTAEAPHGGTAVAQVTVTVTPVADAPSLSDDTFTVVEDSVDQVLSVLANDSLPAGETGALMITAVGTPSAGGSLAVAGDGQSLLYSPAADFAGSETFTYTVEAPHGGTAVAQVTVTVTPASDAPLLGDDTFTVVEDSVDQVLSVLVNDSLPAGETGALTITAVGTPSAGGSLAVAGDGQSLLYSPAADFAGSETFTYTAQAPHGGTAVAQVTVTVTPASDAPLLGDDTFTVVEDSVGQVLSVLVNDSLPAGETGALTITAVGTPSAGGSLAVAGDGQSLLYSPAADFAGSETFTYTAQAPHGGTAVAQVTVTVTPASDAPLLGDDTFTVVEDSVGQVLSVLVNDSLPAGETGALTITAVGTPSAGGSLAVAGDGQSLIYSPAADFAGSETFTYTVEAPHGGTAVAQVTVTVTPASDAPLLGDDTFTMVEDSVDQVLSVLANDSLPAGETGALTITAVGTPSAGGSLAVAGDGQSLLYSPAADFTGSETFGYTAQAPHGGTASAAVTIEVLSWSAAVTPESPSGETGGGSDRLGGTDFVFNEITDGGVFVSEYQTAAIEEMASLVPGFSAEGVSGSSGQLWDLEFSGDFSGDVNLTLAYDVGLVLESGLQLAHIHGGQTQLLTQMPAGSTGPALLDQFILDAVNGEIQITLDQFSGLVLFNQQDPPDPSNPSTLSGRVFLDHNNNGVLDPDQQETPIGGVEIRLEAADGTTQTTFTAADGRYRFEGLSPGDYTITEDPDGKLQQVFADGAEAAGSQGGSTDSAADQISITELAADTSGVDNQHTEGSLQLGFVSRRDFLASTLPTHANAVVEPGAERALAYTLGSGWDDIESALIRLTEDRTEIELQITDTSGTEVATLDAEDPAQVRFRGQTSGIYLVGIIGTREDYAFAPVTAAATAGSGLAGAADIALQQLATEDPLPDGASSESASEEIGGLSAGGGTEAVDTVFGDPVLGGGLELTL